MLFNSLAYILFFLLISLGYFALPGRFRWILLLIGSCYFYMAFVPAYILVLFALILVDYCLARIMEKAVGKRRYFLLAVSVIANVSLLFVFKYFNFFNDNIAHLAHILHWNYSIQSLRLILPIGLSFHVFQCLSYVIEVYKGRYSAEKHLGIYALFVLYFPQMVAGPIERPQHMLPQLHKASSFDKHRTISGLQLIAWGMFKKVVVADRIAPIVDHLYKHADNLTWLSTFTVLILFAFQLYGDFSGYSDIAVGSARILGVDLTRNFLRPYFSTSIGEFWRRWHISLSNWFRDYLYFPLVYSANKVTKYWLYICLWITFLVSGLWHGAGWTYVSMGALHGTYLVVGLTTKKLRDALIRSTHLDQYPRLHHVLRIVYTFSLVSLGWVLFRANSLSQALAVYKGLGSGWREGITLIPLTLKSSFDVFGASTTELGIICVGALAIFAMECFQSRTAVGAWVQQQPVWMRSFVYTSLLLAIITLGVFEHQQFIYFQF